MANNKDVQTETKEETVNSLLPNMGEEQRNNLINFLRQASQKPGLSKVSAKSSATTYSECFAMEHDLIKYESNMVKVLNRGENLI